MSTRASRATAKVATPPRRAPPRAVKLKPTEKATTTAGHSSARDRYRITRSTSARVLSVPSYKEDDSDSSADESSPSKFTRGRERTRPSAPQPRAPKRRRYQDADEVFEDGDETEAGDYEVDASFSPHKDKQRRGQRAKTSMAARRDANPRAIDIASYKTGGTEKRDAAPAVEENIPPWTQLPYLILVQVMSYAAGPLCDDASVRWLLGASRICHVFTEPAITVLYRCPPLLNQSMAFNLIALLARPPETTMFKYRQKIEALRVDVGLLASHVYRGRHLDFKELVSNCPRLSELDLFHQKDMSPYRQLDDPLKWTYPSTLFEALGVRQSDAMEIDNSTQISLKGWRWSQRMMGPCLSLAHVKDIHSSPSFSGLRKVSFVNYQRPSLHAKDAEDPQVIAEEITYAELFAGALRALPDLKHLVIESSTAANEFLLPLLPKTIRHLELINCWDVTATHLADYLVSHGREIRFLTLHHNQSLSLSFLPVLGTSCPNLRALQMNLTYYNLYSDSNPMYDELLAADEVPSWPPSIEFIELENIRKWEALAAENFFQSFVDSAAHLPLLRHLAIKAMLDIPWRQRSQMRDKWEAKLKEVFKREADDPKPIHSLRAAEMDADLPAKLKTPKPQAKDAAPSRRSNRIASQPSGSSSRASSVGRDLRRPGGTRVSYREPDSDEDMDEGSESEGPSENEEKEASSAPSTAGPFIQGLCEVVDIRFDNQKPMETQFGMDDFLDSDHANSDEEWTGDGGEEAFEYAW